jgi:histone H3/H4
MSETSRKLVKEHQKRLNLKASEDAAEALAGIIDDLCRDIFQGAEKIREYSGKSEIDREGVEVAAFVDSRLKQFALKK